LVLIPNKSNLLALIASGGNEADRAETARSVGLEIMPIEVRQAEEIASVVDALNGRTDAFYLATDLLIFSNHIRINALTQTARLPTI
jgi:ABC-type uncharacterized transport system substrate-binding protein